MRFTLRLASFALLGLFLTVGSRAQDSTSTAPPIAGADHYAIETPHGRIVVRLSEETPYHRAAFQHAADTGVYDSTLFHRVIQGFMIQGGDPLSKNDTPVDDGRGDAWPTLAPAEFDDGGPDSVRALFHRRGALAAAREGDRVNPERKSGGQFYLVQGRVWFDAELDQVLERIHESGSPDFQFTDAERAVYTTRGGTPFLDQQYTVFGYVVEGLDVIDAIAAVPVQRSRPVEPVWMTVTALPSYNSAPIMPPMPPRAAPADSTGMQK